MPCHMWRWVSTKPGATIMREASITSALGALILGRTAEILPPSTSTSACSKSPTARSKVSTQPPLIRIARPGAVAPGCWALAVPTTVAAATAVAAVVQRNWRRDSAGDELHAPQEQNEPPTVLRRCVMVSSRTSAVVRSDAIPVRRTLLARRRRAATPAWVAAHQGQRSAGRIGASLIKAQQKARERVTSSRAPASLRPLAAPSLRRAVPLVGDLLEYLGQVGGLVLDDLVELLRRVGHADDELRRELRLDLGRLDDRDDVAIDLLDDRTRHARSRHQAEPGIVDVIQAGLPERRDVRHLRNPLRGHGRKRAHLAGLGHFFGKIDRRKIHFLLATHDRHPPISSP